MADNNFEKDKKIKQAQSYLRADMTDLGMKIDKSKILQLAKEFQNNSTFSYARRLFQLLHQYFPTDERIIEKLAVCTYKDTDLSSEIKFDAAAKLLLNHFEKDGKISDANILGVMGSIFKKKWKYDNHIGHLYQSLRYYLEGFKLAEGEGKNGISNLGYCGINLALLYELLATMEAVGVTPGEVGRSTKFAIDPFKKNSDEYKEEAKKCRKTIDLEYEKFHNQYLENPERPEKFGKESRYWFYVTWAEALLGLGDFDKAKEKFSLALSSGAIPEWMRNSTRMQCFELVEMLYRDNPAQLDGGKKAMLELFGEGKLPNYHNIKYGLALSGGGFRASIFHIGVLAKLAELDLLKNIEVISCVSGGSILGAYYYLKLKNLIESRPKDSLKKQDYIDLVKELENEFISKVNKNVRLNILTNFWSNFRMAFKKDYSRTNRTAELYDKFLYQDLSDQPQIHMDDLLIKPDGDENFRPHRHNWRMENKVPILILNATTLNTGHSWQFTATWMGESPAYIDSEFDALPNLRRMYYGEAPEKYQKIRLSTAVAASAGVPGLFAPIKFEGLYEDGIKVLLVDGGVHDNQGISTLYEQECNLLIISDASGQMPVVKCPPDGEIGVFGRTNSILQERIRFSQFKDLEARKKSGIVRDYMLMHLTKGLPSDVINWKNCDDPYVPPISTAGNMENIAVLTDFLIRKKIQQLLARIRTDLDAFHESETAALMYSGYKMTEHEFKLKGNGNFRFEDTDKNESEKMTSWNFMKIDKVHNDNILSEKLEKKLMPSSKLFAKVFQLSKTAKYGMYLLLGIFAIGILFLFSKIFSPELNVHYILEYSIPVFIAIILERLGSRWLGIKSIAMSLILFLLVLIILWPVSLLVRLVSTKWYLSVGRLPK